MSKLRPLKIAYGLKDGRLVHISEVASGKRCGCVSPIDEISPLVARQGECNRWHFASKAMCDPVVAQETVFHRLAKQMLADERCLKLPAIVLERQVGDLELQAARLIENLEISVEDKIKNSTLRADCVAEITTRTGNKKLVIEWVVTHPCEPTKIEFLRAHKIPSLEIEIGAAPDTLTPKEFKRWALFEAPRHWIWHPLFEWGELRRRGLSITRRLTYDAVRFFKTRSGTKAVKQWWVKGCPSFERIISLPVCCDCPCAYYVEYYQGGYVDCMAESSQKFLMRLLAMSGEELSARINAALDEPSLWYERATPNLGSGFRVGWDKPRTDLVPEVVVAINQGPYAEPPAFRSWAVHPAAGTDA